MVVQHSNVARIRLSGATFLIGLQVFIALLWDHEEMSYVRNVLALGVWWQRRMVGNHGIYLLFVKPADIRCMMKIEDVNSGEQTPGANERLMLLWSVLVIVMFCAMFAESWGWWMR